MMEIILVSGTVILTAVVSFMIGRVEGINETREEASDCVLASGRRDGAVMLANERLIMIKARRQVMDELEEYWKRKDNKKWRQH